MDQLALHKKIEEFLTIDIKSADIKILQSLLVNDDARRFFFSRAAKSDSKWLDWLWENNFLKSLGEKSLDPTKYAYRMPELEYLLQMAEKNPLKVAEIINLIKISEENFNPEVVDRFIWIITALPTDQIKKLTSKIRDEKWVYLMRKFNKSGYEFNKLVEKLVGNKESEAILELAESILSVKNKEEFSKDSSGFNLDDPFYISDLDSSGIFEAVINIDENYLEKALQVTTSIMKEIIELGENDINKIFTYADSYALFDVDFFTIDVEDKRNRSYRADMKNLAATIKKLSERAISKDCENVELVKKLFKYIDELPSCRSMWRLRLYILSLCPIVFKEDLKSAFFKVFEVDERYFEIEGGAEYHKVLIKCFDILDEKDQREYIKKVFDYFGASLEDKDVEKWRKRDGLKIISCIKNSLTSDEKIHAEEIFNFQLDKVKYEPEPVVGEMIAGSVNHKSPVNLDDFKIQQIVENLKTVWSPEILKDQFKDDDFLNPRGAEGLGEALRENIKKRTDEYLKDINSFFNRDSIHSSYLYNLLRGIEEMLRNKQSLNLTQVSQLLGFFNLIKTEGEHEPFKREVDRSWLADWIEVHKVIVDILLFILGNKENREEVHKQHREEIKNLVSYLFTIKDSPSKEDEKPEYGEPYSVAINSVRGRAYEVFIVFIENDGKELADDTKVIFKQILKDGSLAVRFVIGRYLASLYFRDKDFILEQLSEIFPKDDPDKKDIYLATWEGYLSNTLYDKLFIELKEYYSHAITLDPKIYTERKYLKGLDETLAIHLALAFAHLGLEMNDELFIQFWQKQNPTRHHEFISFIGRSCLTRDQAGDKWLEENKVSKDKLIKFWDWSLQNVSEPKAFSGFGLWINPDKEIISDDILVEKIAQTLKKSDGDIDWDYGLIRRLPIFAEKNGEHTLQIINNYLLDSHNNLNQKRGLPLFSIDNEIKQSLGVVYNNGDSVLKQKVIDLINLLIEKGSSTFWGLKEIIK